MATRNEFILENASDARWFLALKEIRRPLLLHSYIIPLAVLETEKRKVLEDSLYNPVFEYNNLHGEQIKLAKSKLLNLREEVWHKESNQSIQNIYTQKIDELVLEMEMLLATQENRWEDFSLINDKKYGKIDVGLISEQLISVQKKYLLFDTVPENNLSTLVAPDNKTILSAKNFLQSGPDLKVQTAVYTSEMIRDLWTVELHKFTTGWQVLVKESSLYISVNNRRRTIYLPCNLKMTETKMRTLFVHEIGTHIYRRESGKRARLQLLSIGLPDYQKAEEGIALVREQLIEQKFNTFGGFDKYLALAYALGLVDGSKKDFQQTFRMLQSYYEQRLSKRFSKEDSHTISIKRAWGSTLRIFRGGNPAIPGCCFQRDKIYREGSVYIWDLLKIHPEYFMDVYAGKFDPGNSQHRHLVEKFKIPQEK